MPLSDVLSANIARQADPMNIGLRNAEHAAFSQHMLNTLGSLGIPGVALAPGVYAGLKALGQPFGFFAGATPPSLQSIRAGMSPLFGLQDLYNDVVGEIGSQIGMAPPAGQLGPVMGDIAGKAVAAGNQESNFSKFPPQLARALSEGPSSPAAAAGVGMPGSIGESAGPIGLGIGEGGAASPGATAGPGAAGAVGSSAGPVGLGVGEGGAATGNTGVGGSPGDTGTVGEGGGVFHHGGLVTMNGPAPEKPNGLAGLDKIKKLTVEFRDPEGAEATNQARATQEGMMGGPDSDQGYQMLLEQLARELGFMK